MTQEIKAGDVLNRRTMRNAVNEYHAIVHEGLNAQERAALQSIANLGRDTRILDIGVGAGRTVTPMRAISEHYVGVDYVQPMVDHCRRHFPGVQFEWADARLLGDFKSESFDLVFFSCNGICMVDHNGRLEILKQVRRVLSHQGVFIFSTCNRNSSQYESLFQFPDFQHTQNLFRWLARAGRFATYTVYRVVNRLRYRRHEVRTAEYAILNDVCHHYQTMLYFIDVERQISQLLTSGFEPTPSVWSLQGRPANDRCRDGTLTFVARKSPEPIQRERVNSFQVIG